MHKTKAVLEYWQQGASLQALMDLRISSIASNWNFISRQACQSGKISDQALIDKLLAAGTTILVAPYYAQKQAQYFFPYILQAELKADGSFCPQHFSAFPIIPNYALESAEMRPIILTDIDSVANHFVLQPPVWLEDHNLLNWPAQLEYAEQMLATLNNNQWLAHLESLQFFVQADALIFPLSAVHTSLPMDYKLLKNKNKLEIIAAERNSGQTTYAKRLITDAWTEAAVKQAAPPEFVWLRNNDSIAYATIFDGIAQSPSPLPDYNLSELQIRVHKELSLIFNLYIRGKQFARNWQELEGRINNKYADHGGIESRIKQLQVHQRDAHARARHMQVLHSIWLRQVELVSSWSKIFDIFPGWQQRRLQRLYHFFKQNFADENVQGLNYAELDRLMNEKLHRSRNSERFIADALYQTESELRQLELVKNKFILWATAHDPTLQDIEATTRLLEVFLRGKLEAATLQYWQIYFALHPDFVHNITQTPDTINTLIVEHAEYVSPMLAAQLLAKTEKAVIMGSYSSITAPRFPVTVDYELARHYKLVDCDADFEDLQFDGISAALGNLWGLATKGLEADKTFQAYPRPELMYQLKHVTGISEDYYGSKINVAEAKAIINWLENKYIPGESLVIFTTFSGQRQYIQNQLAATKFAAIPIKLVQVPSFASAKTCLFSPVYSAGDPGPYSFDRGMEIFDNLIANSAEQIIVFGDQAIFKRELHSASGMFAKKLFPLTQIDSIQQNNMQEEVNCV